jgi:Flp pilus assembly protein TadB
VWRVLAARRREFTERAAVTFDLRKLLDDVEGGLAVGLHVRQAFPSDGRGYRSRIVASTLRALAESHESCDGAAALEAEAHRLLAAPQEDFRLLGAFLSSLALCEKVGANTGNLLRAMRGRLEEREALRRRMRADTAQIRFQAWVLCCAPSAFGIGHALVFPSRSAFFVSSGLGLICLTVVMVGNLAGAGWAWLLCQRAMGSELQTSGMSFLNRRRIAEPLLSLIDWLDGVSTALAAGLGMLDSFRMGYQRVPPGALRDELGVLESEILLGVPLGRALTARATQAAQGGWTTMARALETLAHGHGLGCDITPRLERLRERVLDDAATQARERIGRLPVALLAPLAACVLPALLLLVSAPLVAEFGALLAP